MSPTGGIAARAGQSLGGKALPSRGWLRRAARCARSSGLLRARALWDNRSPAPGGFITSRSFGCFLHSLFFTVWERGVNKTYRDSAEEDRPSRAIKRSLKVRRGCKVSRTCRGEAPRRRLGLDSEVSPRSRPSPP